MRPVFYLASLFLFVGFSQPAEAQVEEDSLMTYELGEVYVWNGTTQPPVGVQRIPLASWRRVDALSVAEALLLIPAAHVQTNSRGETLMTLRGASDRQVSFFLDGTPLTLPWDQRVDLGLLPSGVIGGAIVTNGNAASRFAANGYGGVVNLVSRELASEGRFVEVDVVGTDPGLGRASAEWLERRGGWSTIVALQRTDSEGVALSEEAGLPFSQDPNGARTNSDYGLTSGFARIAYAPSMTTRVGATVLLVDGEKGVPPEGHVDPLLESVRFWRYPDWQYRALMLSGETMASGTHLQGTAWGGTFAQTINRYADADYAVIEETEAGRDHLGGVRFNAERPIERVTIRGTVGWQIANHNQQEASLSDSSTVLLADETYREARWTFGGEAEVRVSPRLTLAAGGGANLLQTLRAGASPTPDALTAPYVDATAQLKLTRGVQLQASAGRGTRFPSMRERHDDALGRFVVNPDLQPESAWSFDIGVSGSARSVSGEVVLFTRASAGTIEVERLPGGDRQRVNLGGSTAYGVEFVGATRLPYYVRADGHLTLLHVRGFTDDENDILLTETPEALGRISLSYQPPPGFTALVEAEYVGTAYSALSDGLAALDPSLTVNVRAGYRLFFPGKGLSMELFGRVNNVSDAVVFPQIGLPAPGRTFLFGISAALG